MIFVNLTADIYDGYVTVKDLELFDCGRGVQVFGYVYGASKTHYLTDVNVENCYIHNTTYAAAVLYRGVRNGYVQDNTILYCPTTFSTGSTIDMFGLQDPAYPLVTAYNTIRRNVVGYSGTEAINFRYFANYNIAEDNIIYNCGTVGIYLDSAQYSTVRRNLIYNDASTRAGYRGWGITIEQESHEYRAFDSIGNVIYENVVAGANNGIGIYNEGGTTNWGYAQTTT